MPQPQQSYYPRCSLNLILRFDEFGAVKPLQDRVPTATTKNLNGIKPPRSDLKAQVDPSAPKGVTRYVIGEPGNVSAGGPQDQTSSVDPYTFTVAVIPSSASWAQNGVKTASTLHATIRYIDCPIDPRVVRSCGVEFYLGCVTDDEAAGTNQHLYPPGTPVIPTAFTGPMGEPRTNLRFQGWVNKWDVKWGTGEPTIDLECQDNTQLLHNQEMSPRLVLDMSKPLDQSVANFLANYVQYQGLSVEYRPSTDTPPILAQALSGTAYRPQLGPQMSKGGGGSSKMSVWDYLTDVCGSVAHNIRMDGTTIIIQRTRSLMVDGPPGSTAARPDDPFQGRTVDQETFQYRRFIYGRNIETMGATRNYSKAQVQNIEVRSYCTERKVPLVARFPLPADRQIYALPGDVTDQKWEVKKVSGISDFKTLQNIAQDYYEAQGRQELSVEIKTKNMGSFGGSDMDPDVLDMKVGDTFELLVNRDNDNVNDLTRIEKALTAQQANSALMKSLGFTPEFANAYAKAYTNAHFLTTYKLKELKIDWSTEEGVSMEITGINYVQVRADKQLPPGQETSATLLKNATTSNQQATTAAANLPAASYSNAEASQAASDAAAQAENPGTSGG